MIETKPDELVVFTDYGITYLAEVSDYSERTLINIKNGSHPINKRFRKTITKALRRAGIDRTQDELFAVAQAQHDNGEAKEEGNGSNG